MGGFRGSVSARWVKAEMHITCLLHAVDPPARRATGTSCWYRGSASPSPRTGKSGLPFIDTCTSPSIPTRRRARARGVALEELAKAPARKMTVSLLDISGDDIARLGEGGLRALVAGFAKRKCASGDFRLPP